MVGGEGMSKQDRQGVRTPADLERKYNLGGMENQTQQHDVVDIRTYSNTAGMYLI